MFARTITNIYNAPSLATVPWYAVTGNHDWGGSVTATFDGDALGDSRWHGGLAWEKGNAGTTQHGDGTFRPAR